MNLHPTLTVSVLRDFCVDWQTFLFRQVSSGALNNGTGLVVFATKQCLWAVALRRFRMSYR